MGRRMGGWAIAWLALVGVGLLSGCTDEKVVFRDRVFFEPVSDEAAGFVGYTDEEDKLTVCGNCHFGQQGKWEQSAHADAWAGLQESGSAVAACEGCHTVSALGNIEEGAAGYTAVPEDRYHDVQCESCHGPGLPHLQDPSSTQPLSPVSVGADLTVGCGECHQGAHHPFVEEWEASPHAVSFEDGHGASCDPCHNVAGIFENWGIESAYLEKESGDAAHVGVTCAVCHDPHGGPNERQLRFAVDEPDEETNLCMKCHHKRGTPDPTTWRGPHSPEGPVILGYGGWWAPNMEFPGGTIRATHGSASNPKLCAGCHLNKFDYTDEDGVTISSTGHLFEPIPCVDAGGKPIPGGECEVGERRFATCEASGCHGPGVAVGLMLNAEDRILDLAAELDALLELVEPGWETCRTVQDPPDSRRYRCGEGSPFDTGDGVYTTAEGAAFNYDMVFYGEGYASAVHNPILMEALLTASIKQVKTDYGVGSVSAISLENLLGN